MYNLQLLYSCQNLQVLESMCLCEGGYPLSGVSGEVIILRTALTSYISYLTVAYRIQMSLIKGVV